MCVCILRNDAIRVRVWLQLPVRRVGGEVSCVENDTRTLHGHRDTTVQHARRGYAAEPPALIHRLNRLEIQYRKLFISLALFSGRKEGGFFFIIIIFTFDTSPTKSTKTTFRIKQLGKFDFCTLFGPCVRDRHLLYASVRNVLSLRRIRPTGRRCNSVGRAKIIKGTTRTINDKKLRARRRSALLAT